MYTFMHCYHGQTAVCVRNYIGVSWLVTIFFWILFFAVESDRAPDLNITLSTGLVARVGDELIITCIADKPRYQFLSSAPYPPTLVTAIFNGTLKIKRCDPNKGPTRCVQTLSVKLTKAGKNVAVLCHTKNDVDCRLKTILLTILERRTRM
jgi:hypothetical protein